MVLTGAGESFSAGMDIKEYFREVDKATPIGVMRVQRASMGWQWRRLMFFPKPTIAMVNGWCFGGAFTPLVSCDIAIAADEAMFGLSEINWGIIPAGNVTRAVAEKMTAVGCALLSDDRRDRSRQAGGRDALRARVRAARQIARPH